LQGHKKLGRLCCEIKALDIPIRHEHAISAILSAGNFGGKRFAGASGSVRRKLEANLTVSTDWDERVLDENEWGRITNHINGARL